MANEVYYRQPKYTKRVKYGATYGRNGDNRYVTECSIHPEFDECRPIGYGTGDTPEEARRNARARMYRMLNTEEHTGHY